MLKKILFACAVCTYGCVAVASIGQQAPAALIADPPLDKAHPATMAAFQISSHGSLMNALAYIPAGAEPHPVAIVYHGFPGNEKNLDLAQAIRRAGWTAIFFDYRGSWGTPGDFSFTHAMEDSDAVIAYLRVPENAAKLRIDPKRMVLLGHSMGGYMAAHAGAHDPGVMAVGLISAVNLHDWAQGSVVEGDAKASEAKLAKGLAAEQIASLAGCTAESLAREMLAHRNEADWNFLKYAEMLGSRPLLVISSDDGLAPGMDRLIAAVKTNPTAHVTAQHFTTDHSYSDQRIAMETAVLGWLATLR
jgi:pimeloyl-ACP methyl ester carboxylesterase